MNILFLGHQEHSVGTFWRSWFLARGLVKLGHRVTLACVSPNARFRAVQAIRDGVTLWEGAHWLHDLPGQGTGPLDILGRLALVQREAFDVVHGFEFHPNVRWPMRWAKAKGALVISDWCDWYSEAGLGPTWRRVPGVQPYIRHQEDAIRRWVDGVSVISRFLYERSLRLRGADGSVLYLPGGAPVDEVRPEDRAACRQRWGVAQNAKVVVFVGSNQEDLDLLAQAFIRVKSAEPQSLLLLIGPPNAQANRILSQAGMAESLRVTGRYQYADLSSLIGCADVCALPLRDTNGNAARWPNKIGEYLAAGRPVVASGVGEMKYLFAEHKIGRTINGHPAEFAEAVLTYFKDAALAEQTGNNGRKIAEQHLAWDRLSLRLAAFYAQLSNRKQRRVLC